MLRSATVAIALMASCADAMNAQQKVPSCPTKPGLYAASGNTWTEIPREPDPITNYSPGYLLVRTTRELPGERAFVTLKVPVLLCAVAVTSNTSFSLEKAKLKKGTRQIVQSGNFHEGKGSQSQTIATLTDEENNVHVLTRDLTPGQYVLVMHGAFMPPKQLSTGNTQADAAAQAIANTNALTQSFASASGPGVLFGFGID